MHHIREMQISHKLVNLQYTIHIYISLYQTPQDPLRNKSCFHTSHEDFWSQIKFTRRFYEPSLQFRSFK